jgi:LDH2 family malate/lactate/ureidoglycolate dehydrogenase
MAVPGSRGRVIGNSPFGYAFPAGRHQAVFLDVATSAAALSKVYRAAESGEMLPDGWIVDQKGRPTNDPASPGLSLVPFGGHKGYGIAVGIEILAGVLAGGGFLSAVNNWVDNIDKKNNCGHAFVAFDVEAIAGAGQFKNRLDRMIDELHNEPKADGAGRIYLPGEIELDKKAQAEKKGLELQDAHIRRLAEIGRMLDISADDMFVHG